MKSTDSTEHDADGDDGLGEAQDAGRAPRVLRRVGDLQRRPARMRRVSYCWSVLAALVLAQLTGHAQGQETIPCKVDAFLACGWAYIPPVYDGITLFPAGIHELENYPESDTCTAECLDIINGPSCAKEKGMLMQACNALQCSVDVKAACGVSDWGEVTWEQACKPGCMGVMSSKTCEGVDEIYAEFKRYKESFGPVGSECSTWLCMQALEESCGSFDVEFQAMPARDACEVGCFANLSSDVCRLAHVNLLLADGALVDYSENVLSDKFGPGAAVCSEPPLQDRTGFLDLLPLRPAPALTEVPELPEACKGGSCFIFEGQLPDPAALPSELTPAAAEEPADDAATTGDSSSADSSGVAAEAEALEGLIPDEEPASPGGAADEPASVGGVPAGETGPSSTTPSPPTVTILSVDSQPPPPGQGTPVWIISIAALAVIALLVIIVAVSLYLRKSKKEGAAKHEAIEIDVKDEEAADHTPVPPASS